MEDTGGMAVRDGLEYCPFCKQEVLYEQDTEDKIEIYCPICGKGPEVAASDAKSIDKNNRRKRLRKILRRVFIALGLFVASLLLIFGLMVDADRIFGVAIRTFKSVTGLFILIGLPILAILYAINRKKTDE